MSFTKAWSDKEVAAVVAALSKAKTKDEALYLAQKATPKRRLSIEGLEFMVSRKTKLGSISTIIEKNLPKIVPVKPEARVKRDLVEQEAKEKLAESEADRKHLLKELAETNAMLEQMRAIASVKPLKPVVAPKRVGAKQRRGCPVLACSDWHVEERVDPKTVAGVNEYTMQIAEERINRLAEAFEWMMRDARFDCREAILALLGDLFSGFIHEELMEKNFLSPVKAVEWLLPRLEAMIRKILASCPQLDRLMIPCIDGNHGRLTHKIRVQSRTDNSLEWLMYHQLATRLRDEPRAQFQICDGEYNYLEVFDRNICFFHGDSVKYSGGVGGILVPLLRGLNELRKYRPVDLVVLGHFHQYTNHGSVVVNGSMIGTTAYSMRNKFPPEKPAQAWFMLDSVNWRSLSAPIWFK